jgi:hypothetical protein
MPQSTNTQSVVAASSDAQTSQKDAPNIQRWEPGLKPSRTGYSLAGGRRHTRALLPARLRCATHKLNLPAWHKPYGEALLATEPQTLVKLLAVAENAFFERILELGDESASDEREDISRAIDVVLDLRAKALANSSSFMPTHR